MKTTSAGFKLGIFALVTLLATGVLAFTIGNFSFGPRSSYTAVFSDATGLRSGDEVRIAGVRVGQVQDVALTRDDHAAVTFDVDASRRLPAGVRVQIRYRNLVGERYVALTEGPGANRTLRPGATIPLAQTTPALDLTVLFNGFKPLFAALSPNDVNTLSGEIIQVLQGEGGTVTDLLARTASLTSTLADRDAVIGRTIDNLDQVLATVQQRDSRLSELILQLQRFVSGLSADRAAIGSSLAGIADLADATSGLLEQGRAPLKDDIAQLGQVASTLDANKSTVDDVLKNLPRKLNTITRTATYGSWFNFYLCDLNGSVEIPGVAKLQQPHFAVQTGRCASR
ncbi:MAG: MCE family protein [Motilibacteraceae bacterium]